MRTKTVLFILLVVQSWGFAQIYLSEIMYNPVGNERYHEFIELYNAGETGPIDLAGWKVGDADRQSEILPKDDGTILAPGHYALVLTENYFLNSTDYDDQIPDDALVVTIEHTQIGSYGLSNSREETVLLVNGTNNVVDSLTYTIPNDDGISDERICFTQPFNPEEWGNSLVTGGTPGYRNSVTPSACDVSIVPNSLTITPNPPVPGQAAELAVRIINAGTSGLDEIDLAFSQSDYKDTGYKIVRDTIQVHNFLPDEERNITLSWPLPKNGYFYLAANAICPTDENPNNNADTCAVCGGYPSGSLLINEIMYSPTSEMPEWFEIMNPGLDPVNLNKWFFYNKDKPETMVDSTLFLDPGGFAVIARDYFPLAATNPNTMLICPSFFPGLRNDADSLVLRDASGQIIDRVDYTENWGGAQGVSLERLSQKGNSNDAQNWANCVDDNGHTAGIANSVYTPVMPTETGMSISPNPFSPDGDGNEDHAAITYSLTEQTGTINIKIFDIMGRQVRYLCNHKPAAATGTVFWDGLDDESLPCRIGIYLVLLESIKYGKGVTDQYTKTVVLARQL